MYALVVLLMLNIIIIVHEFGHYITAKSLGIKPTTFAIGFGKTLWQHKGKDETIYKINLLPLGGYVDFDMDDFRNEKPWKKFWVLFNGAFFNFILAVIAAFIFVALAKIPLIYNGSSTPSYDGNIGTIFAFTLQSVINTINIIIESLIDLVANPNLNSFMGPIQLMKEGSAIMESSFLLSLPLFIMVDVNIMLFNILPFPALDGGRLVFSIIEMFTGKNYKHEEKIHYAGLAILMIFSVGVIFKDVFTLFI